jgi:hypothetical protein
MDGRMDDALDGTVIALHVMSNKSYSILEEVAADD